MHVPFFSINFTNSSNSCCSGEDQEARHQDVHGPGSVLPGERWAGGRHHVQVSAGERTVHFPHWPWSRGNIPWPLKMSFSSLHWYCVPKIKFLDLVKFETIVPVRHNVFFCLWTAICILTIKLMVFRFMIWLWYDLNYSYWMLYLRR